MIDLSKEQYKMLCKIQKKNLTKSDLSERELSVCEYLLEIECIRPDTQILPNYGGRSSVVKLFPSKLECTQKGEAQVYAFRSTFYKWWIPVVISVIALLVSIIVPITQALL